MEQTSYKYYAFISYSRKNSRAAAFLHRELENFRIPIEYVAAENLPENKRYLRPIFRDRRDLEASESNFTEHIKSAIASSRYLIVLCSPEAAQSEWVNEEVKSFLESHDNDFQSIVPVILAGEPGSGSDTECLVPALRVDAVTMRNLPNMIPDAGDKLKRGWENGVLQTLSYMLKVNRDKLKNFADDIKIRRAKRYALCGLSAAILFAVLTLWAVMAEKNARKQAEIAQRTREFMRNMFEAANPENKDGNPRMTVLEALRHELPKIESLSPWQLKAAVAVDIGVVLKSVGEFDQALQLLSLAHELNVLHRPDSPEAADSYSHIGEIYCLQARYNDALDYHCQALECRLDLYGSSHSDVAESYRHLGDVYASLAEYDKAMDYFNDALQIELELNGEVHENIAEIYVCMGNVFYGGSDQQDKAMEYFQKALDIYIKIFGEKHIKAAACYNDIGNVLGADYKNHEMLEYYQKALAINLELLGDKHPDVGVNYINIAVAYFGIGEKNEALKYYEKALKIFVGTYGENHPVIAKCYSIAGDFYQGNEPDKALEYYEKALKILLESRGEQEPTVAKVYKGMGECYRKKGNPLKSLEYFEKALKISVAVFGEKHSNNAYIYAAMGILYLESNDAEKGLEYLEKALAVIIECRGSEHADAKTIQEIIDSIKNPASTSGGSESTQESADPQAPAPTPTPAPAPAPAPAEISSGDDLIEAIRRQLDPDYSGGRSSSGRSSAPAAPAPVAEVQTPQPPASSTNASGISGQVDGVINNRRNPSTPPASRNQRSLIDEVQQAL